eukprot:GHVT01031017.1.p1 GENE.GHVT01031017.1~~GHVT01031017.1.p1  ORF type:complete len:205 (+),score=22.41 GHVT01031017.1:128-742(+)
MKLGKAWILLALAAGILISTWTTHVSAASAAEDGRTAMQDKLKELEEEHEEKAKIGTPGYNKDNLLKLTNDLAAATKQQEQIRSEMQYLEEALSPQNQQTSTKIQSSGVTGDGLQSQSPATAPVQPPEQQTLGTAGGQTHQKQLHGTAQGQAKTQQRSTTAPVPSPLQQSSASTHGHPHHPPVHPHPQQGATPAGGQQNGKLGH